MYIPPLFYFSEQNVNYDSFIYYVTLYSDWEWGQQDGGEGKTGRVMEIRGWDNESCRSVANVSWASGSTNVYRLGEKLIN